MNRISDPGLRSVPAWRMRETSSEAFDDTVIVERAVALVYNGSGHAVMMATPCDLEDFALGFSLSESIVTERSDWRLIDTQRSAQGISIEMLIPQTRFDALQERQRRTIGNSACGLCGSESLQAALRPVPAVRDDTSVDRTKVLAALRQLSEAQPRNRISGGVHAAGYMHRAGLLVREDVGRHNALDKLIGARARGDFGPGFVVVSSRASYELVHKAASSGIALLASVSAPTSAAIELAQSCGLTLIAFAREDRMNVYTHPERLA